MATTQSNPPARADEKTNQELYQKAAEALGALFGTPSKPGIFNQQPIPDGFKSRTEFVRSILDAEGNRAYLGTMPQPHTATLAVVMAARGNPLFPPDLVVEFVARPNEGDDDFDDTASRIERLGLLAEIAELTRDPVTGNSRVALKLPFNGRLDFKGSVVGIFDALTVEEGRKLGLDKVEAGSGFREFATDLEGVVGELAPRTLSPMQRFYLRVQLWAEQRDAARMERDKRRGQHERGGDAAANLPPATPPVVVPKPESEPEAPKAPVIPDLTALTSGGPAPAAPIRTPRTSKKAVVATPATPVVAVQQPLMAPTTPPAEEFKPAAPAVLTAEDKNRKLLLDVVTATAADDKNPASIYAKAFLLLSKEGETASVKELESFINRRNLLR